MARNDRFTFKVDEAERQMIAALAQDMERSQSDAVRLLIRRAYEQLKAQKDK